MRYKTRTGTVHVGAHLGGYNFQPSCNSGVQHDGHRVKSGTPITCKVCNPGSEVTVTKMDPAALQERMNK